MNILANFVKERLIYSAQQQDNYGNNEALFTEKSVKTLTHKTLLLLKYQGYQNILHKLKRRALL